MATDRDEQLRQQQELEEIRRSFAEMGARMGSLFEPAETEQVAERPALPAPPPAVPARPRRWAVAALAVVFLLGGAFGYVLPRGTSGDQDAPPPSAVTATTGTPATSAPGQQAAAPRTRTSVPEACLEVAELADEIIARLNRGMRDNRLATALVEYAAANQACRREASP